MSNSDYLYCHELANKMLKKGEIKAFSCSHCRERGRIIHIETHQGWDPEPMYQDYPPERNPEIPN